jgi:glycosyltransferase involved in cell wall biosynthesis
VAHYPSQDTSSSERAGNKAPRTEKIRLLFVYAAPYFGSVWTVMRMVAQTIDPDRFDLEVVVDENAIGHIGVLPDHVKVSKWSLRAGRSPGKVARMVGSIARLVQHARSRRIDIVQANEDANSAGIATAIAKVTGARLLLHYHTVPSIYSGGRLALMRAFAHAADRNVGVSRFVADEVARLGIPRSRLASVQNAIEIDRFHPTSDPVDRAKVRSELGIAQDAFVVLQLARFWRPKRQEDLVRAVAIARERVPELHALLVGWTDPRYDGTYASYPEELRALAKSLGVEKNVTIADARPDPERLYAASDACALPSVDEPFGLVVVEAMACELPTIGARAGGIAEIFEDGREGLLVPPQSPQALADAIVRVARDPELARKLATAGRQKALASYSPARVGVDFGTVFEGVLGTN